MSNTVTVKVELGEESVKLVNGLTEAVEKFTAAIVDGMTVRAVNAEVVVSDADDPKAGVKHAGKPAKKKRAPAKKKKAEPKPEADDFADFEDESKSYTRDDVKAALKAHMQKHGKTKAVAKLKEHGKASSLAELKEENFAAVIEACDD